MPLTICLSIRILIFFLDNDHLASRYTTHHPVSADQILKLLAIIFSRYPEYKFLMATFAKGNDSIFFISSGNLLPISHQLAKFEVPSYINFKDIRDTSFHWPNLQITWKKYNDFFYKKKSSDQLLYQLTKFEAPSYNKFRYSLIESFQCPNLQRAIALKIK